MGLIEMPSEPDWNNEVWCDFAEEFAVTREGFCYYCGSTGHGKRRVTASGNVEYSFATEQQAQNAWLVQRRSFEDLSFIAFDPSRNVYVFDVIL